jgi:hypothetical protein
VFHPLPTLLNRSLRSAAIIAASALLPLAAQADAATDQKVQQLADQIAALQNEVNQLKTQQSASAANSPFTFFGYGEMSYLHPLGDPSNAKADLNRFVGAFAYRFDDSTRFVSEVEIEHAVSSADDSGEAEIEQAYIEHEFGSGIFIKGGLFLIPSGLLNENHEPTRYYGVFRNGVETAIIPTTWREGGVAVQGNTDSGLRWDVGLTTGFNLSKWDATASEGQEEPLGSIHGELSNASAKDLSGFAALNYTGVPGLRVGASLFTGGVGQGQPLYDRSRLALWEAHARWTPGALDLSALYAHGHFSNTADINTTLVGNPTLIPESFFGWYVQAAYKVIDRDSWSIAPFIRHERYNTGASYADIGAGLTPAELNDTRVWACGVNWNFARSVVVKFDRVEYLDGSGKDRYDVGLGYQF